MKNRKGVQRISKTRLAKSHRVTGQHAFAKLKPLLPSNWDRYRKICEELAKQFGEASNTPPAGKARGEAAR